MRVYNKLVRDNIPLILMEKGLNPETSILSEEEYCKELDKKLLEEINEYLESGSIEELADIKEVILAILETQQVSYENFEKIRTEKKLKRGGFKKRILLKRVV